MENLLFVNFSNDKYGLLTQNIDNRANERIFMILIRYKLGIFCLAILIGFGILTRPAGAQPISGLKLDVNRISWTALSFSAKNFWVAVSTDVELRSLPVSDLEALLLTSSNGNPIKPQTSEAAQMTIHTTIGPRFRTPVNIYNRIWFDPTDASAFGRIRLRRGEEDFKKMYRFTDRGVFRHRIEPKDKGETRLEPDKWTDIKDTFYPYDKNQLRCPGVSERSVLIYIISAVALSNDNKPLTLCMFGKRQLHRVQLRKEGTLPIRINYIEKNQQVETLKQGTVRAIKIMITAQPLYAGREEVETFSFLGFQKDIAVYIDPSSGLPIQANGIIPTVGKADLKLQEVYLKQ